jgi:hypothetical protein
MNRKIAAAVSTAVLVAAMSVIGVSSVWAQNPTPAAPAGQSVPANPPVRAGGDFGFFGGSIAAFDAQAKALNLTPTALFEQLHSGKTLSEIATAQGVDVSMVQEAVRAVQTQAMKDRIAQAVKDGTMTQAQADWQLQGIEKGYMGHGGDFGPMGGRGGRGMRGPGPQSNNGGAAPSSTTTPGSQS